MVSFDGYPNINKLVEGLMAVGFRVTELNKQSLSKIDPHSMIRVESTACVAHNTKLGEVGLINHHYSDLTIAEFLYGPYNPLKKRLLLDNNPMYYDIHYFMVALLGPGPGHATLTPLNYIFATH